MKNVTGRVVSAEPIFLFKAATLLSGFTSSDNGASQDVSAYLRRASAAFTELKSFHREFKSKETKPSSDARRERNVTGEIDAGRHRKSATVSVNESIVCRGQEKKKKKEDVVDEKVKEKLEDAQRSEERNERMKDMKKKRKRKSEEEIGVKEKKSKKRRKLKELDA